MFITIRKLMLKNIAIAGFTILGLSALTLPAQAGFLEDTWDSVENEWDNCTSGGCDPTNEIDSCLSGGCDPTINRTPGDFIETTTGARAVGAAFDRWAGRQVRIQGQKVQELEQSLKQYISENYTCMQVPETAGLCENLNELYGLNMPIQNYYWEDLLAQYSVEDVEFLQQCIADAGLPFDNPYSWGCLPLGEYVEYGEPTEEASLTPEEQEARDQIQDEIDAATDAATDDLVDFF